MRDDAAFGRHERRVGEDEIRLLVPAGVVAERIVDVDGGIREAMQEEVHLAELHHEVGDVVAGEVLIDLLALGVAELVAGRLRAARGVVFQDVLVGGDEEAAGAAGGIEDFLAGLRIEAVHDEVDDVAGRAELAVLALRAHALEQVFEGVAEFLAVGVGEAVDLGEEHCEDAPVAEFQECIAEDVPEQAGQVGGLFRMGEGFDALREERHAFLGGERLRHQRPPAECRQPAGEERAFPAHGHGLLVEVVHELVDQRERDELHLVGGQRELADEDVPAGVDAALGFGGKHVAGGGYADRAARKGEMTAGCAGSGSR